MNPPAPRPYKPRSQFVDTFDLVIFNNEDLSVWVIQPFYDVVELQEEITLDEWKRMHQPQLDKEVKP